MAAPRQWLQELNSTWQSLSLGQRAGLILFALLGIGILLGVGWWATQPDYRVLDADLSPEEAGAITAKLRSLGVDYRLEHGGTTILVPADRVGQVRLDLAVDGLPTKGGKGLEIFDEPSLGATPFTQHVNYQRALQGELAKTITQIDSVSRARVHIVRPEASPFIREQKPTTASVFLRLKPGATMNRSIAAGIVALVTRSVEGLKPENVTLLDQNGRVLSEQSGEMGHVSTQLDYRRSIENHLAFKAEEMLTHALGPGRAIVRVAADVNFQWMKEKKKTFDPQGKVIASESTTSDKSTTTGSGARGAAGATSNLPGRTSGSGSGSGTTKTEGETTTTEFKVSETERETEARPGDVERITIAAMVDLSGNGGSANGSSARPLTAEDVAETIKKAVGFKADRDEIKVTEVRLAGPVSTEVAQEQWEQWQSWQNIIEIVRNSSLGVGAVLALVLCLMLLQRVSKLLSPSPPGRSAARPAALDRIATVAAREPEAIARALAAWLEGAPPNKDSATRE
jgi:flagellar M-ring protein FliF